MNRISGRVCAVSNPQAYVNAPFAGAAFMAVRSVVRPNPLFIKRQQPFYSPHANDHRLFLRSDDYKLNLIAWSYSAASAVLKVFLAVASLRHKGCFFSVAGLPKLASEQVGDGEETMGEALASASGFICFFSEENALSCHRTYL